jgi:cytochrome c oxidase subunit III
MSANIDVARLPSYAFGTRSLLWWAMIVTVAIEGSMMGLLLVAYFYVRGNYQVWPPSAIGPAAFRLAVAQAVLLTGAFVATIAGNYAATGERLRALRVWFFVATVLGAALLAVRCFEFRALPFQWDTHAYGSVFWTILGVHTFHVAAGVVENLLLLAVLVRGPVEKKHFVDAEASGILWYFTFAEWVVAFPILYLEPIFLAR